MDNTKHRNDRNAACNELRKRAINELSLAKNLLERKRHDKILLNLKKEQRAFTRVRRRANSSTPCEALNAVPVHSEHHVPFDAEYAPPPGVQWVRARNNIRLPEGFESSFFIPYVDEKEENILSSSVVADELYEADSDHDDDSDVEGKEIGDGMEGEGLRDRRHGSRMMRFGRRKIGELRWDRAAKRIALHRLSQQVDDFSSDVFVKAVSKAFNLSKPSYVKEYLELIHTRYEAWMKKKKDDIQLDNGRLEVSKLLLGQGEVLASDALQGDSITFFFCRQCYVYDCSLHGQQVSGPTCPIPDKTRRDSAPRQVCDEIQANCANRLSEECWHASSSNTILDSEVKLWWSDFETSSSSYANDVKILLKEILPTFGEDFCRVAELLRIMFRDLRNVDVVTCKRIGYIAKTLFPDLLTKPESSRYKPGKYRASNPVTESKAMNGGKRPDFFPCRHDGPCTSKNCTCVQTGVHCEKYCGCNHNRPNQSRNAAQCYWAFKGCSCKSAVACTSKACICFSWKRECDPDLCKTCHDCKVSDDGVHSFSCRNVGLQHKKGRRTVAGRSDVHGWGIFATLDIARNELVGEYVGEVIEDQEAERRGRVYDLLNSNFLFDITTNYSLDSSRIGNKLRYCNHSSDPNCEPRLMRVGGDIRIGIFAKRDIRKYEELFFDYGPNFVKELALKEKVLTTKKLKASNVHHADLLDGADDDSGDDSDDNDCGEVEADKCDKLGESGKLVNRDSRHFSKSVPLRDTRKRVHRRTKAVSDAVREDIKDESDVGIRAGIKSMRNDLKFDSKKINSVEDVAQEIVKEIDTASEIDSGMENGSSDDRAFASQMSDTGSKRKTMSNGLSMLTNGARASSDSVSLKNRDNNGKMATNSSSILSHKVIGKPPRDVNKASCKQENNTQVRDGNDDDADGGPEDGVHPYMIIGRLAPAARSVEKKGVNHPSQDNKEAGATRRAEQPQQLAKRQLFNDVDLRRPSILRSTPESTGKYKSRERKRFYDRSTCVDSGIGQEAPSMDDHFQSNRVIETGVSARENRFQQTESKFRTKEEFRKPDSRMSSKTNVQGDFSQRLRRLRKEISRWPSENELDVRSGQNDIASQCSVDSRDAAFLKAAETEISLACPNSLLSEGPHHHASLDSLGQFASTTDKIVGTDSNLLAEEQTKLLSNRSRSFGSKSGVSCETNKISERSRSISFRQERSSPDDLAETPAPTICSVRTDEDMQFSGVDHHHADPDVHYKSATVEDVEVVTDYSNAVDEVAGKKKESRSLTNEGRLPALKRKLGCPGMLRNFAIDERRSSKRFKMYSGEGVECSHRSTMHTANLLDAETKSLSSVERKFSKNRSYFYAPRVPTHSKASRTFSKSGTGDDSYDLASSYFERNRDSARGTQEKKKLNQPTIDVAGKDADLRTLNVDRSTAFGRSSMENDKGVFSVPETRLIGRRNSEREGRYSLPPLASDVVLISSLSGADELSGQDLQGEMIAPTDFLSADEDDVKNRIRRH